MINLNQTPEAILTMNDGEHVTLDGHTFRFDVDHVARQNFVYLTMTSNTTNIARMDEEYDLIHVRSLTEVAMMERDMLMARIKNKQYTIN